MIYPARKQSLRSAMGVVVMTVALGLATGCSPDSQPASNSTATGATAAASHYADPSIAPGQISLTSSDFSDGDQLPDWSTADAWGGQCTGENDNPELSWTGAPEGTTAFALTMVDTTAEFAHWAQANIPASDSSVPRGTSAQIEGIVGSNSTGDDGYFGPCPPSGTHEYQFTVWALDATVDVSPGMAYDQLIAAMDGHVLASSTLTGLRTANDS
jgi:hypothetical protein